MSTYALLGRWLIETRRIGSSRSTPTGGSVIPSVQDPSGRKKLNSPTQIPALTDKHTDGSTIRLFESGSIMQYLVDKYDTEHKVSYPHGTKEYYETNSWVCQAKPISGVVRHY